MSQQRGKFLRHCDLLRTELLQDLDQPMQIACVGVCECHTLAFVGSHIQRVIPVGVMQAKLIVRTHVVESAQVFQQNVFQHRTLIDGSVGGTLTAAVRGLPHVIVSHAPADLTILEVRRFFQQHREITGLVQIELCRDERPERMIHPDAGNVVAVCNEFALLFPDDGRIRAVHPDTAVVVHDHTAHIAGVHDEQRQTVLPQVAPAAPALAVVVVRQERAAEDATQNRLEADPLQIVVPDAVAGSELHIDELLPVLPDLLQCGCRLDRSVQHVHQSGQGTRLLCQTKANNILCAFAGSQRDGIKCHCPHRLPTFDQRSRRGAGLIGAHGLRVQEGAALAQEHLRCRIDGYGQCAVRSVGGSKIEHLVFAVTSLIKREARLYDHAVGGHADTVQKGRHMAVIAQIIRTAPVQRHGRHRGKGQRRGGAVYQRDKHSFLFTAHCHEALCLSVQPLRALPLQCLPKKPACNTAFFLLWTEFLGLLRSGRTADRPDRSVRHTAPKVAGAAVAVQIFYTDGFQQKCVLVDFAVPAQIGRHGAFQPPFACQRQIQPGDVLSIFQREYTVTPGKPDVGHGRHSLHCQNDLVFRCQLVGGNIVIRHRRAVQHKTGEPALFMGWILHGYMQLFAAEALLHRESVPCGGNGR